AGTPHLLPLLDPGVVAQDDDADVALVEVEREAQGAVVELQQLVGHRGRQALDVGNAVARVSDDADLVALGRVRLVLGYVLLESVANLLRTDRELRHFSAYLLLVVRNVRTWVSRPSGVGRPRGDWPPSRR